MPRGVPISQVCGYMTDASDGVVCANCSNEVMDQMWNRVSAQRRMAMCLQEPVAGHWIILVNQTDFSQLPAKTGDGVTTSLSSHRRYVAYLKEDSPYQQQYKWSGFQPLEDEVAGFQPLHLQVAGIQPLEDKVAGFQPLEWLDCSHLKMKWLKCSHLIFKWLHSNHLIFKWLECSHLIWHCTSNNKHTCTITTQVLF